MTKWSNDDVRSKLVENEDGSFSPKNPDQKFIVRESRISSTVSIGSHRIHLKPMSVNGAWAGRRFKSEEYKAYEKSVLSILPDIVLPVAPYQITFIFGVSNAASDWDNPIKPIQDILQKRYGFNDKDIYKGIVEKVIVPKREEYFEFKIETLK